jgi:hypothetical protein
LVGDEAGLAKRRHTVEPAERRSRAWRAGRDRRPRVCPRRPDAASPAARVGGGPHCHGRKLKRRDRSLNLIATALENLVDRIKRLLLHRCDQSACRLVRRRKIGGIAARRIGGCRTGRGRWWRRRTFLSERATGRAQGQAKRCGCEGRCRPDVWQEWEQLHDGVPLLSEIRLEP